MNDRDANGTLTDITQASTVHGNYWPTSVFIGFKERRMNCVLERSAAVRKVARVTVTHDEGLELLEVVHSK